MNCVALNSISFFQTFVALLCPALTMYRYLLYMDVISSYDTWYDTNYGPFYLDRVPMDGWLTTAVPSPSAVQSERHTSHYVTGYSYNTIMNECMHH